MGDPSEIQKGILQPAWMVKAKLPKATTAPFSGVSDPARLCLFISSNN
jgi:hypothetical protein